MSEKRKKLANVLFLSLLILACTLCLSTFMVGAEEDDDDDNNAVKGKIKIGAGLADDTGSLNISGISPGRAAEYLPVESSALVDLWLSYDKGKNYLFLDTKFMTVDDYSGMLTGSMAERQLLVQFDLEKFTHRMDNDPMSSWSRPFKVTPETAAKELEMRVMVLNSSVRYKPASIPASVLFLHMNIVDRGGEKQARTLDHCYSCHVNTKTQELDQRTLSLIAGAEYAAKPFAVNYRYGYSSFEDSSTDLTYDYENRFGNFSLEGVQPFASFSNNETSSHKLAARYDVEEQGSVFVTMRRSDTENQNTGYSLETTSFSSRFLFKLAEWVSFKGRYDYRDSSNSTPYSSSRKITRLGGTAVVRPMKSLKLEGGYRYQKLEREGGTEVGETTTKTVRIKALWRPSKKWRISGSHSFIDRENPFGRSLRNSFSRLDDIILSPFETEQLLTNFMVLYTPDAKNSFNASYYSSLTQGDAQVLDATLRSLSVGWNHNFDNGFGCYGHYYYFSNDFEKEIYLGVIAPFLTVTPLPYEGQGSTFSVGAWGHLGKVTIRPGYSYTTTTSSFDDSTLGAGLVAKNSTDVTINRLAFQAGLPLSDVLDINMGYYLDDYSDRLQPQDDGKIQWFYTWIGYEF